MTHLVFGKLPGSAILLAAITFMSPANTPAAGQTILHDSGQVTIAPDPGADPNKVAITDLGAWHYPTKAVFAKYKMIGSRRHPRRGHLHATITAEV